MYLWEKARVGCFKRTALKHVYYQGWNRSPVQIGCMRQVLWAGALGRPRGIGWTGRWEGGSGWGILVNPWLIYVNVWQKPLQYCKVISLQLVKINEKKKRKISYYPQDTAPPFVVCPQPAYIFVSHPYLKLILCCTVWVCPLLSSRIPTDGRTQGAFRLKVPPQCVSRELGKQEHGLFQWPIKVCPAALLAALRYNKNAENISNCDLLLCHAFPFPKASQILEVPHTFSLEKTLRLGKIKGKKRRGQQRMRWLDSIPDPMDMNLSKLRDSEGQGTLACCSSWGCKESGGI